MSKEKLKIFIAGDCSDWNQENLVREDIPADIRKRIESSDIFIFNLEGPIIDDRALPEGPIKNRFARKILKLLGKAQPEVTSKGQILDILKLAPCNVACLANNHILDGGSKSINNTIVALKQGGFLYLGAGENIVEASKPLTVSRKGKKIGVVNYNFIGWRRWPIFVNVFGATNKRAGANYAKKHRIQKDVESLSKRVDYTIAILHIGRELEGEMSDSNARFLKSLRAELIITHHAHIAQTTKESRIFSCGDFIFNYPSHLPENRKSSFIEIVDNKVYKHNLVINNGLPCLESTL